MAERVLAGELAYRDFGDGGDADEEPQRAEADAGQACAYRDAVVERAVDQGGGRERRGDASGRDQRQRTSKRPIRSSFAYRRRSSRTVVGSSAGE